MRRSFSLVAVAALASACSTDTTSPTPLVAGAAASHNAGSLVIDDFHSGSVTISACGNGTYNLFQDASVAGGAREIYTRDAGSCHNGTPSKSVVSVDATAGTLTWGGANTYSSEEGVMWGTEIGTIGRFPSSPNAGHGAPLNLSLSLGDKLQVDMKQVHAPNPFVTIRLRTGTGATYSSNVQMSVGSNLVPLSSFAGLTAAAASDIDGISFSAFGVKDPGDVFLGFSIAPSDATPPVITANVTGTMGTNGWYTSDVAVSWTVTDDESAVSSKTGCDDVSITSDTDGQVITCNATSSGGSASQSVTIKRDATLPTVSYTGNAGTYAVDQSVAINCSATDATNPGSGLASSTCADISGAAYTFAIGANAFGATATDNAGNVASNGGSFNVVVTGESLCALTTRWVTQPGKGGGIANSLCVKISHGQMGAYANEVQAQSGKAIAADKASVLIALAAQL